MRGAGLVRVEENNEPRFLGPSSGIAMTRLVIQLAMQSSASKTIKEIVPEEKSKQIKDRFDKESAKPSSKVYPLISSVAAPDLPTRALTDQLVDNYNRKGTPNLCSSSCFIIANSSLSPVSSSRPSRTLFSSGCE
jgi:hypothetical protein